MDEKINGLLTRLPEVENKVLKPVTILIMSGVNNALEHDYSFVNQLRRIVIHLTNSFPETEMIASGLLREWMRLYLRSRLNSARLPGNP